MRDNPSATLTRLCLWYARDVCCPAHNQLKGGWVSAATLDRLQLLVIMLCAAL